MIFFLTAVLAIVGVAAAQSGESAPTTYALWSATDKPASMTGTETKTVELGVRFTSSQAGTITAVKFFKRKGNAAPHKASVWDSSGRRLATVRFANATASGWQRAALSQPVRVTPGSRYVVSYTSKGLYPADYDYFTGKTRTSGPLTADAGVYNYGLGFPTQTYRGSNYYVDLVFKPGTSTPPPPPSSTTSGSTSSTTSPSPTTSSSSSTTTSGVVGCAARPSSCGYPDATNTGVPAGTVLHRIPQDVRSGPGWRWDDRGWVSIYQDGVVFSGYSTSANIDVTADNVTIQNSRVVVGGEAMGISLRHTHNVRIDRVQIAGLDTGQQRLMVGIKDVYSDSTGLSITRSDISRTATGIQIDAGLIEGNYIHDLGFKGDDHVNGTTSNGGTQQLTIRHNTVFNHFSQTDAISLFQDFGPQANRLITNNLVAGGGYAIYAGANPGREATATGIVVTNNRFATLYFPRSGHWGPLTAFSPTGGNVFSGNVWDHTGQPVTR